MSFVSTVSGTTSNSYISVAQADAYFAYRYDNSLWPTSTKDKERLLVTATRRIDQEVFTALKSITTQSLQWPRSPVFDRDGNSISNTTIPQNIINAVCEYAYFLLQSGSRTISDLSLHDLENLESYSASLDGVGSESYTLKKGGVKANKLPQTVIDELVALGSGVWIKTNKATIMKL